MHFNEAQPFICHYDPSAIQEMKRMMKSAILPAQAPVDIKDPWELGIDLQYLKSLKSSFEDDWSWNELSDKIHAYPNFLVHFEDEKDALDLHFVHARSSRADAIPLLLLHGWPGTFLDFYEVIEPLTNPQAANVPAFHVVIPSIPGYVFSTLPRRWDWDLHCIAKLYNGLMKSVLGYSKYVCQGGDWGSHILHIMGNLFPDSLMLLHFNYFCGATPPADPQETMSDLRMHMLKREEEIFKTGFAIGSSPLAILAYIAEKIYAWSDPKFVEAKTILDNTALYFLTGCFATSVMIYNQTAAELREFFASPAGGRLPQIKNKIGYSLFPYEMEGNKAKIEQAGPLAYYKEHTEGGHFPALDCPEEFVSDLREFFGANWSK